MQRLSRTVKPIIMRRRMPFCLHRLLYRCRSILAPTSVHHVLSPILSVFYCRRGGSVSVRADGRHRKTLTDICFSVVRRRQSSLQTAVWQRTIRSVIDDALRLYVSTPLHCMHLPYQCSRLPLQQLTPGHRRG